MRSTPRAFTRRLPAIAALAAIAFGALFVPTAHAATSAARPTVGSPSAHYSGSADASLLRANVSLTDALSVADVDLTHSTAAVDSSGTPRSSAESFNTGTLALLNQQVDLSTLLARASQTAPPQADAADDNTVLPIPLAPLLDAGVSNATARALWAGDTACTSADQPVALGHQDIAHLTAVSTDAATLLGLNNDQQGASYTTGTITLPATGGPNDQRAVVAQTSTRVASLDVLTLAGMAPLIHVDAVGPYNAIARATGLPGGATVDASDPVVNVSIAGQPVIPIDAGNAATLPLHVATGNFTLDTLLNALSPLLDPLAQVLSVEVPPIQHSESADGTTASVSGALLRIRVLTALGTPLASVDIAPFSATATAPLGGLECSPPNNPITVTKNASSQFVSPGDKFNYTITVGNSSADCTLSSVNVTDVITAPKGSEVTATDPSIDLSTITKAASTDSSRELITVPFGDVGSLDPGASKAFTITIKVPASALPDQTYDDKATATGTCNGVSYTTPFTLNGIPTVAVGVLAKTGADSMVPLMGAGALLLAFLGFRRLRRA